MIKRRNFAPDVSMDHWLLFFSVMPTIQFAGTTWFPNMTIASEVVINEASNFVGRSRKKIDNEIQVGLTFPPFPLIK